MPAFRETAERMETIRLATDMVSPSTPTNWALCWINTDILVDHAGELLNSAVKVSGCADPFNKQELPAFTDHGESVTCYTF